MKKLLVIILAAALTVLVFTLGGCVQPDAQEPAPDAAPASPGIEQTEPETESEPEPAPEPSPAPDEGPAAPDGQPAAPAANADCTLKFKSVSERSDGDYTKVYDMDCGGEYVEYTYLWCDAEMTGFECVAVEMVEDGEYENYVRGDTISRIDSVKPGEAVYVTIELPEIIPNAAFVYTAGGEEYIWLIGCNGRDGGMWLTRLDADKLLSE